MVTPWSAARLAAVLQRRHRPSPVLRQRQVCALVRGEDAHQSAAEGLGHRRQPSHIERLDLGEGYLGGLGPAGEVGVRGHAGHLDADLRADVREPGEPLVGPLQRRQVRALTHQLDALVPQQRGVAHELLDPQGVLAPQPRVAHREQDRLHDGLLATSLVTEDAG